MTSNLEVVSKLGKRIRVSKSYWDYIVGVKHPSLQGLQELVRKSLSHPVEIRRSERDPSVYLYYGAYDNKLNVCVVARHLNGDGFIITAYLTGRKIGEMEWKQRQ